MLAGVDPLQAGLYQMMIMFLIAASSSVGTMGAVLLGFHRLFNREHQFLPSRISQRSRMSRATTQGKSPRLKK